MKNYAEIILLIDKKYISKEASYTTQQSSRRVKSPKTSIREYVFAWYSRNNILKQYPKQFTQIFGDSTLQELC